MEIALPDRKPPDTRSKPRKFADWLRRTMRRLKGGLPPESWERKHSPVERSAARRRIAELIDSIAEKRR